MRPCLRIGLALTVACGQLSSALAQGPLFDFLNIAAIDRSEIDTRDFDHDPPPLREGEAFLSERTAPASPDESLGLPVSRIGLDAEGLRAVPTPPLGSIESEPLPLIEFTVAGYLIRMPVIEIKTDRDFEALHLTLISPDSDDYARLTVSVAGPEVVGTVVVDDFEYRILPENDDYQLVYPVVAYNGQWRRENPTDLASRAGQLEARHLQIGWVADMKPGRFDTYPDGRPSLYGDGPSLGKLAFWSAFEFTAAGEGTVDETILAREVENYLNAAWPFTWARDRIDVRVDEIGDQEMTAVQNNGVAIQVTQLLNDIPISEPLNLSMAPSGDVIAYRGFLARYDMVPQTGGEQISAEEAREISAFAMRDTHGLGAAEDVLEDEKFYHATTNTELELIWRIRRKAECGVVFQVDIDATTGSVLKVDLIDAAGIRGRTLEDTIFQCRYFRAFRTR